MHVKAVIERGSWEREPMYIDREVGEKLVSYLGQFKVVLVTGSRQVGKTTLLRHVLPEDYGYVTLDDVTELSLACRDPTAFLDGTQLPVVIDEVQQAPELSGRIKAVVDRSGESGQVVITGSQTYQLMRGVSESLAGRIGILEMSGLSLREICHSASRGAYVPGAHADGERVEAPAGFDLWTCVQRGSMPRLQDASAEWSDYYANYVRSYLERDVRQLINVKDEMKFFNFMVACAARTGQLLNATDIADTIGVDVKTAQGWISVLRASGIVHVMQPFWANATKRLAKTPKLYFMDTGLACYLTAWNSAEQLRRGAMAGHMFETFVVSEVLKSYMNAGRDVRSVSFYRDARKREIDLVIQDGHVLHPVEIKAGAQVGPDALRNFSAIGGITGFEVGAGAVICQTERPYSITRDVRAVPVWAI